MDYLDATEETKEVFVPFVKWVKQGVAKSEPDKIKLTREELEVIINKTSKKLKIKTDDETVNSEEGSQGESSTSRTDINDEFNLEHYDEEDATLQLDMAGLADLANDGIRDIADDDDDDDSEKQDDIIKPQDNLVLVAKIEGDASILEVHVYNESEDSFYCHHDILLSAFPLCIEWLDHETGQDAGNYCAVTLIGERHIDIWDLDIMNCLEPAYSLGKEESPHTGDIIDLAWNSNFNHILASSGTDAIINLWDLDTGEASQNIQQFTGYVQSVKWHLLEAQTLLAGSADKTIKVFDCRNLESCQTWESEGEVEKVCWDPFEPFCFLAGTSCGLISYYDCRKGLVWSHSAHTEEISGLAMGSKCQGFLMTTSTDGLLKTWDISGGKPECVMEKNMKMGMLHTAQISPDSPFTVALGGNNKSHHLFVTDLMKSELVNRRFGKRHLGELKMEEDS